MIKPHTLQKGDLVAITCPAKKPDHKLEDAVKLLQSWELEVIVGETVFSSYHQFAGDDNLRAQEMQKFINDKSIKAIFAARGGYGCLRIVDKIDFTPLLKNPKWLIGFSDITVFHSKLHNMGMQSIHAQMPINMINSSKIALESLRKTLFNYNFSYQLEANPLNKLGKSEGILIGGNLSLLVAQLGSETDINYDGKILFIEDVGEYLYAIDRLMHSLDRAKKLSKLKALIVGGFTSIKDNDIPFGFNAQEIIHAIVDKYNYPILFDFPAGHIADNRAIILGANIKIDHLKINIKA